MPKHRKLQGTITDSRDRDNVKAAVERNRAVIDYIAMMADLEIDQVEDYQEEDVDRDET